MRFENNIFFARETGIVTGEDAERWSSALVKYAASNPTPVVAFVDARDLVFITEEARQVFIQSSKTPNIKAAIVTTSDHETAQSSRLISLMSRDSSHITYVFSNIKEALVFAEKQAGTPASAGR
jgi:hypothetical protein